MPTGIDSVVVPVLLDRMGFQILRDDGSSEAVPDGSSDGIAGQLFESYDEAHAVLERYYADLCCSDDRIYYRIEERTIERH
ncbi:MAG: hypothetical protein ACK5JJ_06800 [Cyanobacteriota bacterium]